MTAPGEPQPPTDALPAGTTPASTQAGDTAGQGGSGKSRVLAPLSQVEFVALIAMLFSTIAFSIDAMLPALPEIAAEVSPGSVNRAQLIVTSFVLGMGLGTLVTGPLSDAFGRKPVILWFAGLYILGAALAWQAESLEFLLAARVLQGIGAAGPRVVAIAIVRDLYEGRTMARIMSFVILVFTIVPALAPSVGALIIWLADWRTIFLALMVFSAAGTLWLALRQPETLPPERRRPFRARELAQGTREVLSNRLVATSIAAQALCLAMLFATLSSIQQVFDVTYGRGDSFHLWFAVIALLSGSASLLNAQIVERFGMRAIVSGMLAAQVVFSTLAITAFAFDLVRGDAAFALYFAWTVGIFFQAGMTLGNLNALAMAPMGHLAGLTASVMGSIATVLSVLIAVPIGLLFDGTPRPLIASTLVLALLSLALLFRLKRIERTG